MDWARGLTSVINWLPFSSRTCSLGLFSLVWDVVPADLQSWSFYSALSIARLSLLLAFYKRSKCPWSLFRLDLFFYLKMRAHFLFLTVLYTSLGSNFLIFIRSHVYTFSMSTMKSPALTLSGREPSLVYLINCEWLILFSF